jgi:hypothetical protein
MTAPTTARLPTERVRELRETATPGPWTPVGSSVVAEHVSAFEWEVSIGGRSGYRHADASLIAAAPDLAADLLDARQERDALADTLRTERAAREAAEGAIALLSRTLGCESDTPKGIVTEALDYAAEQRERAEAADDAVARAADADARSANLLMCGEAAERAAEEAHAQHAALAGAVRAYLAAQHTAVQRGATNADVDTLRAARADLDAALARCV